jgi:hypothetical protein
MLQQSSYAVLYHFVEYVGTQCYQLRRGRKLICVAFLHKGATILSRVKMHLSPCVSEDVSKDPGYVDLQRNSSLDALAQFPCIKVDVYVC